MAGGRTTLQHNGPWLVCVHHLLHDWLKHAPKLSVMQALLEGNVERVPLAVAEPYLCWASSAGEVVPISMEGDSHDPALPELF